MLFDLSVLTLESLFELSYRIPKFFTWICNWIESHQILLWLPIRRFKNVKKNVFSLTSLLIHTFPLDIRVFNADRMLYSRFRFQKSANLYLLRSSLMLSCLRLFSSLMHCLHQRCSWSQPVFSYPRFIRNSFTLQRHLISINLRGQSVL